MKSLAKSKSTYRSLEDFELEVLLQKGSYGEVHRATDKITKRKVAIKIIQYDDSKLYQRKLADNEIKINQMLPPHPNIIPLLHVLKDPKKKKVWLVLEFAPNGTLCDIIRTKGPKESQIHGYFIQIVSALEHLHNNKIVHCDLKPENLLLDDEMNIKLCDFGFSQHLDPFNQKMSQVVGTKEFLAPEIHERSYDYRVDLWALGVILYDLFHMRVPYGGSHVPAVYRNIMSNPVYYSNKLDPDAKNLMQSLLKINPSDRISLAQIRLHPWIIKHLSTLEKQPQFSKENDTKQKTKNKKERHQKGVAEKVTPHFNENNKIQNDDDDDDDIIIFPNKSSAVDTSSNLLTTTTRTTTTIISTTSTTENQILKTSRVPVVYTFQELVAKYHKMFGFTDSETLDLTKMRDEEEENKDGSETYRLTLNIPRAKDFNRDVNLIHYLCEGAKSVADMNLLADKISSTTELTEYFFSFRSYVDSKRSNKTTKAKQREEFVTVLYKFFDLIEWIANCSQNCLSFHWNAFSEKLVAVSLNLVKFEKDSIVIDQDNSSKVKARTTDYTMKIQRTEAKLYESIDKSLREFIDDSHCKEMTISRVEHNVTSILVKIRNDYLHL